MTACERSGQSDERPTVMVIDDELGPRESLRFLLKEDYRVVCAETVAGGLHLMRERLPDTVVLDIRMPGQSGLDGLREIRKIDPELAVILLTGFAAVGTAQEAIRLHASDYMEKPFDAVDMRNTVRRNVEQTLLRRKRSKLLDEAGSLDRRIRELQGKDRLAELGQTSAEFVHDLRNALVLVTGPSSMLRQEMNKLQKQASVESDAGYYLDTLEKAMRRCVDMLDTWQRLLRQNTLLQTRFRLHEFVEDCLATCQPAVKAIRAQMTCETLGDDAELLGDRVQLTRALNNLIQNAIHALPADHGSLHVRSEVLASSVRVSVTDNGYGIPEENLQSIFSPDFTTRSLLGGIGLGLFIAQKIAQAHGGTVTVESTVNKGSTFTLLLPRTEPVRVDGVA